MAEKGIVLRQNLPGFTVVNTYYSATGQEHTRRGPLPVDRVDSFANTFKSLAETILAKKRSHVVVVAHGNEDNGLIMPITTGTKVATGEAMTTLLAVVDSMDSSNGASADSDALDGAAHDWGVSTTAVLGVAKPCWKIRSSDGIAVAVHIRGCNIGANTKHLHRIRRLFRSVVVSAPNTSMFYVMVSPGQPVKDVEEWGRKHGAVGRRYIYTGSASSGIGPMLLDIEYTPGTGRSSSQAAVQNRADIKRWAAIMHGNPNTPAQNSVALAGLYPRDLDYYYLAHESGYVDRLVAVRDT